MNSMTCHCWLYCELQIKDTHKITMNQHVVSEAIVLASDKLDRIDYRCRCNCSQHKSSAYFGHITVVRYLLHQFMSL